MLPVTFGVVATGIEGELSKAVDGRRGHLRWNRHREPAVSVADGVPQGGISGASDEDRGNVGAGGEFDDGHAGHIGDTGRLCRR